MIYEATVQFTIVDDKGNDKSVKESVILEDCDTFTEVETEMYDTYDGQPGLDVIAIKRSRLKEIANRRSEDNENIFIAEVCDTIVDDNGDAKETSYKIAFFAQSIDKAKSFIDGYLKQGYDMRLKVLQETKFVNVL